MNENTLFFPAEISHEIGLPANAINAMKNRGCPFFGKKTTIRWVRDFVAKEAGRQSFPVEESGPRWGRRGRNCVVESYRYTTGYRFRLIFNALRVGLTQVSQIELPAGGQS